jgi:hypothetical protein
MSRLITPDNMRGGSGAGGRMQQPAAMQIIDVGRDPALKSALLQGRIQSLAAPFMYHDPAKQFCFVLMPLEMNIGQIEQQRIIGQMTQAIMRALPQDAPRGYLLQPRIFFTFQSMVEAILEGDGVTPEMLKAQQAKVEVLREMVRTADAELRRKLARDNDAKIDAQFFELLSATMDANMQAGRDAIVQQLSELQKVLIEETAYGKVVGKRLTMLDAFQKTPTREVLLEQLIAADEAESREMLITVGRQLLDYAFFQALTQRVDATADAAEKERLVSLRKEVQDIRDKIDAAGRAYMQEKAQLIQTIAGSKDPLQTARENADLIDDAFLQVIQMNAQQAQQRGDENTLKALSAVNDIAVQVMAERQPPEVQIVNALVQAEYPEETKKILEEIKEFADDRIIQVMIQYADQLSQQDRSDLAAKLTKVMVQARAILPKYDPTKDRGSDGPGDGAGPGGPAGGTPPPAPGAPSGLVGADGLIRGSSPPSDAPKPKIEIARR